MRAKRTWQIEGVTTREIMDCLTEWLEAYDFEVQRKTGIFRKGFVAKTVQYSPPEMLTIFFEFDASKTSDGASLRTEYYGMRSIDNNTELDLTIHEVTPACYDNPQLYYLREYAKSLIPAFEKYFGLDTGKTSVWHSKNIDENIFSEAKIHEVLTEEVMPLREIAKKLGIEKISDVRKLHRNLVSLCNQKPEVFGGFYGTRITGGYRRLTPILEGSFWRRDVAAT